MNGKLLQALQDIRILCAVLLVIVIVGTCGAADSAGKPCNSAETAISIPLPESTVLIQTDGDGLCRFTADDIQHIGRMGEPAIPCQAVTILLPPDADLASVRARVIDYRWVVVDGRWEVQPVPPLTAGDEEEATSISPLAGRNIVNGKDTDIYNRDALFPAKPICSVSTQEMRGWKLAQVLYAPYSYNPIRKQLYRLSGSAIEVTFRTGALHNSAAATNLSDAARIKEKTANFAEMSAKYAGGAVSSGAKKYVIITTNAIGAASTKLASFIASKEARGFTVEVVTESAWGGGTGDAAAENIRSWLISHYAALGIDYVLLIGNPHPSAGDVPMKMCYPQDANPAYSDCPTDFYYAELTSDWDGDRDGRFGEYDDDFLGDPPRAAEVAVGRIPYYGSITDLDHILSKIIAYESAPAGTISWRTNVLLPMNPSDIVTPGYHLGEEIKDLMVIPKSWTYHRIYDSTYGLSPPPETVPCTINNVKNAWVGSDFGAIFWWAHGSETQADDIMNITQAATLDDEHPGFTFQASCLNGKPEASNNLGYSLLRNGAIATVSASRVCWYEIGQTSFSGTATAPGMACEYAKRLITGEMCAGDALNDLRLDISPGFEQLWMNYIDFNLYGCPAVGLLTSTMDRPEPSVTTDGSSRITATSARLNGRLTSLGTVSSVIVSFIWGTTPGGPYPNETPIEIKASAGTFYFDLYGLVSGVTYYFRAKAVGNGIGYGIERSFTTPTQPSVATNDASNITATSARLNGNLVSLGTATSVNVSFQWDIAPHSFANETAAEVMVTKGTFHFDLSNLNPGTTYYFRAKAIGDGISYGSGRSFTTQTIPPSVDTSNASNITATSARLNGNLVSLGTATSVSVSFQWGTTSGPYSKETTAEVMVTEGTFHFDLSNLNPGTTYYFRAKAAGHGTSYAAEGSFTTLPLPRVEGVDPGSGRIGQSMVVRVLGANFMQVNKVSFGPGVLVDGFTVDSTAQISARIRLDCDTIPGPKDISVMTEGSVATLSSGFTVIDLEPEQPCNRSPADHSRIVTLTPVLSASAFLHACHARSHTASQWQVTGIAGDYTNPVFDSGVDSGNLTAITIPRGIFTEYKYCWWRVRYQDNRGMWSDWSPETGFALPDFIRAELDGSGEIRVYDSSSRMTGSADGQAREGIMHSRYYDDGTVIILFPTDNYIYQVVGVRQGNYTLTVILVTEDGDIAFVARDIPLAPGEVHQYLIDWDALSRGENGVTLRIDANGNGTFEKKAVVGSEIDAGKMRAAMEGRGVPVWIWVCVGIGVFVVVLSMLLLPRVLSGASEASDITP